MGFKISPQDGLAPAAQAVLASEPIFQAVSEVGAKSGETQRLSLIKSSSGPVGLWW